MSAGATTPAYQHRPRVDEGRPLVKVAIGLDADHWLGFGSEVLWAEDLGHDKYRLLNSPFAAYGYSYQDVVAAHAGDAGELVVGGVVVRGGHSTYRLFLSNEEIGEDARIQKYWTPVEAAGCTFECATDRLIAVDVPPSAEIHSVYKLLEDGEAAGVWEFEEGHCGHPVVDS